MLPSLPLYSITLPIITSLKVVAAATLPDTKAVVVFLKYWRLMMTVLAQIAAKATSSEIWKSARSRGVKTMLEDGLIRVAKGQTTIEEVIRVIA
jgi:hypothetical protein